VKLLSSTLQLPTRMSVIFTKTKPPIHRKYKKKIKSEHHTFHKNAFQNKKPAGPFETKFTQ